MHPKKATIVIFGGTGDLMKRKLLPAFSDLAQRSVLGKETRIIGVGRHDISNAVYQEILFKASPKSFENISKESFHYVSCDFSQENVDLKQLAQHISIIESDDGCDRLFYLATSYRFFPAIVKALKKAGLSNQNKHATRIIFEKPFGSDLQSFDNLSREIRDVFQEEQIFLIDHFLAKAAVRQIVLLKQHNPIFKNIINSDFVESITIVADEHLGAGERIEYYNHTGALRDMVQNHLLQLSALILMESSSEENTANTKTAKVSALYNFKPAPAKQQLIGQYNSYRHELESAGIPYTKTETFARITLESKYARWAGVPLVLRTGKKLPKKVTEIRIQFKKELPQKDRQKMIEFTGRELVITIHPSFKFVFYSEKTSVPIPLELVPESKHVFEQKDEYALLLEQALIGEHLLFATADEIHASWEIIEQVEKLRSTIPFVLYDDYTEPCS